MIKALFYYRIFVARNRMFSGTYKFFPDIEFRLSANETIEEFVREECDFIVGMASYTEELYSAYLTFCSQNSIRPVRSKSGFAQRLAGLFPTQIRPDRWREDGKNIRGFTGILLRQNSNFNRNNHDSIIRQKAFSEYDDSDDYWDNKEE